MIKKAIIKLAVVTALWLALLVSAVWSDSPAALTACFIPVLFVLLSAVSNRFLVKGISASVETPLSGEKSSPLHVLMTARTNRAHFPCVVKGEVEVFNRFTGERMTHTVPFVNSGGVFTAEFELEPGYCGTLEIGLKRLWAFDLLELVPVKIKARAKAGCTVFPDTFESDVTVRITHIPERERDSFSENRPGNDLSEIYGFREYVPGDPVRLIHWKLGEKYDKTMVMEPGMPVLTEVLLFCLRTVENINYAESDALAECVSSVGTSLCGKGIVFDMAVCDSEGVSVCPVNSEQAFFNCVQRILGSGFTSELDPEMLGELCSGYSRVICFAGSAEKESCPSGENISLLRFGEELDIDDYTQRLQCVEL